MLEGRAKFQRILTKICQLYFHAFSYLLENVVSKWKNVEFILSGSERTFYELQLIERNYMVRKFNRFMYNLVENEMKLPNCHFMSASLRTNVLPGIAKDILADKHHLMPRRMDSMIPASLFIQNQIFMNYFCLKTDRKFEMIDEIYPEINELGIPVESIDPSEIDQPPETCNKNINILNEGSWIKVLPGDYWRNWDKVGRNTYPWDDSIHKTKALADWSFEKTGESCKFEKFYNSTLEKCLDKNGEILFFGASRARQAFIAMSAIYNDSFYIQDYEQMPKGKPNEVLTILENSKAFPEKNVSNSKVYNVLHYETYGKFSMAEEINTALKLKKFVGPNVEYNGPDSNIKLVVLESRLRDFLRVLDKTVKSETPKKDKLEKFRVFEEDWSNFGKDVLEKHEDKTFVIMLDNPVGAEIESKDDEETVNQKNSDRKFGQTLIQNMRFSRGI